MLFYKKNNMATAIHISHNHISICGLKKTKGIHTIETLGHTYIQRNDHEQLSDKASYTIQKLLAKQRLKQKKINLVLHDQRVFIRKFLKPEFHNDLTISASPTPDFSKLLPFNVQDYYIDFIQSCEKDSTTYIVAAAPKKLVKDHMSILEKTNLKPFIAEPSQFSLVNLAKYQQEGSNLAILHIDKRMSFLNIICNDQFERCHIISQDSLLSSKMLTDDIKRCLVETDTHVSKILINGNLVNNQELLTKISQAIKVSVKYLDPFANFNISPRIPLESFTNNNKAQLAISIGAALRKAEY